MWPFKRKTRRPAVEWKPDEVLRRTKSFVLGQSKMLDEVTLHSEMPLFSSGLLDSLAFMELVMFVEAEFGVRLSDVVDVNLENLDRLDQIVSAVVAGASGGMCLGAADDLAHAGAPLRQGVHTWA